MLLKVYGADMAATATYPHNGINGGLRAAVRAGSYGKPGFIFVNNYERLAASMPVHENVRFQLDWPESNSSMTIPSANIPGVNVTSGVWFVWPLHLPLGAKGSLLWATAQLLTVVKSAGSSTWIFSATVGIVPSMAFRLEGATIKDCKCNVGSNGVCCHRCE